jgi:hypothetical protein
MNKDVVEKNGTQYQVTVCKGYYRLEKLNKQRRVDNRAKAIIIENLDGYTYAGYMVCGLWKIVSPAV